MPGHWCYVSHTGQLYICKPTDKHSARPKGLRAENEMIGFLFVTALVSVLWDLPNYYEWIQSPLHLWSTGLLYLQDIYRHTVATSNSLPHIIKVPKFCIWAHWHRVGIWPRETCLLPYFLKGPSGFFFVWSKVSFSVRFQPCFLWSAHFLLHHA